MPKTPFKLVRPSFLVTWLCGDHRNQITALPIPGLLNQERKLKGSFQLLFLFSQLFPSNQAIPCCPDIPSLLEKTLVVGFIFRSLPLHLSSQFKCLKPVKWLLQLNIYVLLDLQKYKTAFVSPDVPYNSLDVTEK